MEGLKRIVIERDGNYWSCIREREKTGEKVTGMRTLEEAFHYARVHEEPNTRKVILLKYDEGSYLPNWEEL